MRAARRLRPLLLAPVVACVIAACGGSTASGPAAGDGGCITPTAGEACTKGESACQPPDPCCAGYEWTCDTSSGTWQQSQLGCACQGPPPDASSEQPPPGDGGCISPVVGEACTSSESACQPHDPCCAGYEWVCTGGTWQQEGLGCACQGGTFDAGPFTCGTATCAGGDYCQDHPPGIAPADGGTFPDAYECLPVPASCAAMPTCACIESTLPSGDACSTHTPGVTCTDDGAGHVILHCIGV